MTNIAKIKRELSKNVASTFIGDGFTARNTYQGDGEDARENAGKDIHIHIGGNINREYRVFDGNDHATNTDFTTCEDDCMRTAAGHAMIEQMIDFDESNDEGELNVNLDTITINGQTYKKV